MSETPHDNKRFEIKVGNLISVTRHLDAGQILLLRRLTLADPESLKWATKRQLHVVFNVILGKALERLGPERLQMARELELEPLLPNPAQRTAEDRTVIDALITQILGTTAASSEFDEALRKLLAIKPAAPHRRTPRQGAPLKEPPPLFAAQLGHMAAPSPNSQPVRTVWADHSQSLLSEHNFSDFDTLFDETLCSKARKVLELLRVSSNPRRIRLPFILAPGFAETYEEVLRRMILPQLRASRHIQNLANGFSWEEAGSQKLLDILQGGEVNNPILHNWDLRWNSFRQTKDAQKKGKPGTASEQNDVWAFFRAEATRDQYQPPDDSDLPLLQSVIRFEAEAIAKAWRDISLAHEQEFPGGGAQVPDRDGMLRDSLLRWSSKLPDHLGEFLMLKAAFDLSHVDNGFLRRLHMGFGRTESERRRNAPTLTSFLTDTVF